VPVPLNDLDDVKPVPLFELVTEMVVLVGDLMRMKKVGIIHSDRPEAIE
jgi:hypothetical protein